MFVCAHFPSIVIISGKLKFNNHHHVCQLAWYSLTCYTHLADFCDSSYNLRSFVFAIRRMTIQLGPSSKLLLRPCARQNMRLLKFEFVNSTLVCSDWIIKRWYLFGFVWIWSSIGFNYIILFASWHLSILSISLLLNVLLILGIRNLMRFKNARSVNEWLIANLTYQMKLTVSD